MTIESLKNDITKAYAPCFIQRDRARRALFVLKFNDEEKEKRLMSDERFVIEKNLPLLRLSLSLSYAKSIIESKELYLPKFEASFLYTALRLYLPYREVEKEHIEKIQRAMFYLDEKDKEGLALFMQREYAISKRLKVNPPALGFFAFQFFKDS